MPAAHAPDSSAASRAAALLHEAWVTGRQLDGLPEEVRPRDEAAAYRVQRALDAHLGRPVGWKLGATSAAAQQSLGVPGPFYARLFEGHLVPDGGTLPGLPATMGIAEAEFAFVLGRDLPASGAPYGRSDVLAAIAELRPAIEVPESRYVDVKAAGGAQLVADAGCGRWIVLGAPAAAFDPDALPGTAVSVAVNGEEVARGSGAAVLGNPVDALAWLASALAAAGLGLRAGDVVMTGASAPPNPVRAGDLVEAAFAGLGSVSVALPGAPGGPAGPAA